MGDTKRLRRDYVTPTHPWEERRIDDEEHLMDTYGLKNKKELWRMNTLLKGFKDQVKKLNATSGPQAEREERQLLQRLRGYGIIDENDSMDSILALDIEAVLNRRLQTRVYREGLARTIDQARQFIVHQHVTVDGECVDVPSFMVQKDHDIAFADDSPLSDEVHPERVEEDHASDHVEEDVEEVDEIAASEERRHEREEKEATLGFHEDVVQEVLDGKTKTYRLREHVNEEGDTVACENTQTGEVFGEATITDIEETTVGEIDLQDEAHGTTYAEVGDLIAAFEKHHPDEEVTPETTAYIYTYEFTPKEERSESVEDAGQEETELPARSTIENKTKDEIKEWAADEYGVELSTNDLKDEMIDQLLEEVGDGE